MRKVAGGWFFVIIIPIGMIACFFLYDFGAKIYFQNVLDRDTKVIFQNMMDREGLDTNEEKLDYVKREFKENGYEINDISLSYNDDNIVMVAYNDYMSIVGTLSFGFIGSKNKMVISSYKGYYNEYNEAVIEKYKEDQIEDLA